MKQLSLGLLVLLLAAAGCSEGPASPMAQAAVLEPAAGDGQVAAPGAAVAVAPAVLVRGAAGRPLRDVGVEFTVTAGGGSVAAARVVTNADGIASAGAWTLGGEPGVNTVEARAGSGAPVVFTATAAAPESPEPPPVGASVGRFDIDVRWVSAATTRQRAAVDAAVQRWRSVVVGDLVDIPMTVKADACFDGQPALNEVVDDLLIFVEFVAIDGPRQVLGQAGPCYVRSEGRLPVIGYLKLDSADLALMESAGTLDDVVLHEIGHILGIGTLWPTHGLLSDAGGDDPRFLGPKALAAYQALGGTAPDVAVENTGSAGSRDGHWRETEFGNELMTPLISGTPNPLSALTVASLADLGYGATSSGASAYALGGTRQSVREPVDMRGRERLHGPKFRVDRNGRQERLDELPEGAQARGLRP